MASACSGSSLPATAAGVQNRSRQRASASPTVNLHGCCCCSGSGARGGGVEVGLVSHASTSWPLASSMLALNALLAGLLATASAGTRNGDLWDLSQPSMMVRNVTPEGANSRCRARPKRMMRRFGKQPGPCCRTNSLASASQHRRLTMAMLLLLLAPSSSSAASPPRCCCCCCCPGGWLLAPLLLLGSTRGLQLLPSLVLPSPEGVLECPTWLALPMLPPCPCPMFRLIAVAPSKVRVAALPLPLLLASTYWEAVRNLPGPMSRLGSDLATSEGRSMPPLSCCCCWRARPWSTEARYKLTAQRCATPTPVSHSTSITASYTTWSGAQRARCMRLNASSARRHCAPRPYAVMRAV
mmetsp:Transcript_1698/g.3756  ORF Transcript_1698/g.3756 Transcript_1698/m.3756 type:complete len:354 (-) Transcript_1698:1872-2933(-)